MWKRIGKGISFRMVFCYMACLIPLYALMLMGQSSYMNVLQEQIVSSTETILNLNINTLEGEIRRINIFEYYLTDSDTNYQALLDQSNTASGQYWIAWLGVHERLLEQVASSQYDMAMFIHVEDTDLYSVVTPVSLNEVKQQLEEDIRKSPLIHSNCQWRIMELAGEEYLVHAMGYYGVFSGAVINLKLFMEELQQSLTLKECIVSIDEDDEAEASEAYIAVSTPIHATGHNLYIYLNRDEIFHSIPFIYRFAYVISILSVLFIPVLLVVNYRTIIKPLHKIEEALHRLGEGEQDYRIPPFPSSREFENLQFSFNSMADEITNLKIESYEKELEKEQIILQNLQLQIGPHFLLNLFHQIFSMAQLKDYDSIQIMCLYLAKYFRYLFHSDKTAAIKDELDIVRHYLKTMRLRYVDCFEVVWELDECVMECRIPPLLLHNLVDNIFKYAVSEGTETKISICIKKENEMVLLIVEDDGPGMEAEIVRSINNREKVQKKDGTHVGIWNAVCRLKRFCGEDSFLRVQSVLSEGTIVTVGLPLGDGGKYENIDDTDCG